MFALVRHRRSGLALFDVARGGFEPAASAKSPGGRRRTTSTGGGGEGLVLTEVDEGSGVATLTLNRPPANSLSMEMLAAISSSLRDLHRKPEVQGLVLRSANPSIFSAGLDVAELLNPDPNRLPLFWRSFQQVYLDLYGSRMGTVAAIEGHAPAAGCMLALCCDHRVMAATPGGGGGGGGPKIGLNETLLGIAAPPWLGQLMVRTVGFREAERALGLGVLYGPEEALGVGLVDEVVPKEEVGDAAMREAVRWAGIPPKARVASKLLTRKEFVNGLDRKEDTDHFCFYIKDEEVQRYLAKYVEGMKKKRA